MATGRTSKWRRWNETALYQEHRRQPECQGHNQSIPLESFNANQRSVTATAESRRGKYLRYSRWTDRHDCPVKHHWLSASSVANCQPAQIGEHHHPWARQPHVHHGSDRTTDSIQVNRSYRTSSRAELHVRWLQDRQHDPGTARTRTGSPGTIQPLSAKYLVVAMNTETI